MKSYSLLAELWTAANGGQSGGATVSELDPKWLLYKLWPSTLDQQLTLIITHPLPSHHKDTGLLEP